MKHIKLVLAIVVAFLFSMIPVSATTCGGDIFRVCTYSGAFEVIVKNDGKIYGSFNSSSNTSFNVNSNVSMNVHDSSDSRKSFLSMCPPVYIGFTYDRYNYINSITISPDEFNGLSNMDYALTSSCGDGTLVPNSSSGNDDESKEIVEINNCPYYNGDRGKYIIKSYSDGSYKVSFPDADIDEVILSNSSDFLTKGMCPNEVYLDKKFVYNNGEKTLTIYNTKTINRDVLTLNGDQQIGLDGKPVEPDINDPYNTSTLKTTSFEFCDPTIGENGLENGTLRALKIVGIMIYIVKILVPLIIIVLGSIDLAKAAVNGDDKATSEALQTLLRRLIIGIVIFFVPTIVKLLISMVSDANDLMNNKYVYCTNCLLDPFGECQVK